MDASRPTRRIFIGLLLGVACGLLSHHLFPASEAGALAAAWQQWVLGGVIAIVAGLFMALLKMLVVPLVFVSLVTGVGASSADLAALGRIGMRTLVLYLLTTAFAVSLALLMATWIAPGAGADMGSAAFTAPPAPGVAETIIALVPTNPLQAMVSGNLLQVIVFSLLLGFALVAVGERAAGLVKLFGEANEVVLKLVDIVMRLAPLGVFALVTRVFAEHGMDLFSGLAWYAVTLLLTLLLHVLLVYLPMLQLLAGVSPRDFLSRMRDVFLVSFSTASSAATLPVTLRTAEQKFGVPNRIASFTLPLGATVNMDGTAIMQGVATCFIAQAYGVDLGISSYLVVIAAATLASIGTAAVPSAGFVTLTLVLSSVGLPFEAIGVLLGIDRLLDMMRTSVNVTGDVVVTLVVTRLEGAGRC